MLSRLSQLQISDRNMSVVSTNTAKQQTTDLDEKRKMYVREIYLILVLDGPNQGFIEQEDLVKLELNHLLLSRALGRPVGIIKSQKLLKNSFNSLTLLLEN